MGDTASGARGVRTRYVRRRRIVPEQSQAQQRQRRTPQEWMNYFDTANDTQASAALNEWRQERMDADQRSNDTDVQRFLHNIGWSENTPEVLDERQYQAAWRAAGRPQQIYHADRSTPYATDRDYALQYFGQARDANGNLYRQYASNGYFGGGTYFARTASSSARFGDNQFRGFLNSNARVITMSDLERRYNAYARSHPAFRRMMNNVRVGYGGDGERKSIFAAMLGYNVIDNGMNYYTVLDRRATTVSTQQRRTSRRMADW